MMRTKMMRHILVGAFAAMFVLNVQTSARAQGLDLMSGSDNQPIAVDAQGGIEWRQEEQVFIADGPASATRGDMVLYADQLRAFYREGAGGGSEIFRLEALGNVRITTPGRVATGGNAVYDVDKSVVVLKDGNPVKMVSGADVITAKDQLEFWEARSLAVARGGAVAVRADKKVHADVLTAHFEKLSDGSTQIGRVEAFDNVVINTKQDQVFADRAAYNVPTGLARLTGSVKIKRGDNQITGCSADIDLNTGVSRLNSCDQPAGSQPGQGGRVHGVLTPNAKN
ncbi:LptA/OstA family protein [Pseudomonadota bacterium]